MFNYSRMRNIFTPSRIANGIFRETLSLAGGFFTGDAAPEQLQMRRAFQSLVHPLLLSNGQFSETKKMIYRRLLEEQFERSDAEKHLAELNTLLPMPEADAIKTMLTADTEYAKKSVEFLLALAVALEEKPETFAKIRNLAEMTGVDMEYFDSLQQQLQKEHRRKIKLIRSGRGIIAALIIIVIFVLTAKFLQSVIFGLLLSCLLLPVEKFFERHIRNKSGLVYYLVSTAEFLIKPLQKISFALTKRIRNEKNPLPASDLKEQNIIRQAVSLTVLTTVLLCGGAIWGVSTLTGKYMTDVQKQVQFWEKKRDLAQKNLPNETFIDKTNYYLEELRIHFENLPPVRKGLVIISNVINNQEVRTKFAEAALEHSGGIFNFTTNVVGKIATILGDMLLTIFFALLFLLKMAKFYTSSNQKRKSEYLVRTFFNGIWLPGADENVLKEAGRIIEGIIFRLRIWLKGYLTLIMLDSTVYTICFFFIGVPFFLPLGILAGCGIALPYLGPILSCCITILVTLAAGDASGNMLLAIIICYLIYNGIIEQFILYPAVIGESLGLSTLETIIVILLGAVFAGIPGMIFALPTASVAKYIIPEIYRGLIPEKKA